MKYALDSSLAVKWVLPEPDSNAALALRAKAAQGLHTLIAPDIFPAEIAHALTKAERQGRINPGTAVLFWNDILQTPPDLLPHLPIASRAIEIASQARIGFYDCLYVALAEQEGCELVTADDKLLKNLKRNFPYIARLADVS